MVKRIKKVTREKVTRERKKIIVIGTEGKNKTEVLYFRELEKKQRKYHCIFVPGNETDPVKIVRNTAKKAKEEELSIKEGDMAISVFDIDADESKIPQLQEAKESAKRKNISIVSSNPCGEVWYLEHFGYTTKPFVSSAAVIKELEKKIPGYQKSVCNFELLYPRTETAIKNCEKLDLYHADNSEADEFANPRTDMYKVVRNIISEGGDLS